MITKILIAVNDEEAGTGYIQDAFEIADKFGGEIALIDVAQLVIEYSEAGRMVAPVENVNIEIAENTVNAVKKRFPGRVSADFEPEGDPVTEIRRIIGEWKADMLIVGHHKKSFFQKMSDTSREKRLINNIDIPVLVLPCVEQ